MASSQAITQDYPNILVLGNSGNGKSLFTTFYALLYQEFCALHGLKNKVFANYHLELETFQKVKLQDIVKFPSWLRNGLLILDEIHSEGGDAYHFLEKDSQFLTTFITQIRKRNIQLIVASQRLNFVNIRIRELVNYYFQIKKFIYPETAEQPERIMTEIEVLNINTFMVVGRMELDLTPIFKYYDTDEIISQLEINEFQEITEQLEEPKKTIKPTSKKKVSDK